MRWLMELQVKEMIKYVLISTYVDISDLPIIAPIRDKNLDRGYKLNLQKTWNRNDSVAKKFSIDQNLWGRAIEGVF